MTACAWITGGGSGIGRALTLELATHGWHVAISGRSNDTLAEVANAAPANTVSTHPCDVTDLAAMRETANQIEQQCGRLDLAVFNAGTMPRFKAAEFDAEAVTGNMHINYGGAVHGIDAVLPGMRQRGAGHIALVASIAGYRGIPLNAPYSASKAAMIALAESLKFDLDPMGITMTVITPGYVKTPLTAGNKAPMPLLVDAHVAARRIRKGLEAGRFEITFPRRLSYTMKIMRSLPYVVYFPLMRKVMGN